MIGVDVTAVERDRLGHQARLDAERSARERNRLGQFATPPALAEEIARYALRLHGEEAPIHFADPAIGTGSFFSALLRVAAPGQIGTACGVEIDPRLAAAARGLWADAGLQVIEGDFTAPHIQAQRGPRPNLIVANPPYVRHHHLNQAEKQRLQALTLRATGITVNGLAGLYVYFFLLASAWLEDDGLGVWLIPSEFMDVNYGAAIRRYLTEHATLLHIHRYDPAEVQFDDALVTSAVVVFRRRPPAAGAAALLTHGGSLAEPRQRQSVPLDELRRAHKWTVYPRVAGGHGAPSRPTAAPCLGDLFKIQRGIATGGNDFFILELAAARARGLPDASLTPILPSPRHLRQTIIERAADGYPLLDPQLALLTCDLPEGRVEAEYPALWDYLLTAPPRVRSGYLVGTRTPWYRQERRARAPFLCTYMGRGSQGGSPFRFIWNRSEAVATNLYLLLYPINALARLLHAHPDREATIFDLLQAITTEELRQENRVYGGGLQKMEPGELARVSAARLVERLPELATVRQLQMVL
jgi:adenine-specific DNA-methyltransferase